MSAKQVEVVCPSCACQLTVDVSTGKVMRHVKSEERDEGVSPDARWSAAQGRVKDRTTSGQDKLESALENERTKAARYDELFRRAQEKQSKRKPDEE